MLSPNIIAACLVATLLVVIKPGADNILAIGCGLSQGCAAAILSSVGAGLGILLHTLAAAFGLTLVIQASPTGFWAIKLAGTGFGT